jgi:hypothetical protein
MGTYSEWEQRQLDIKSGEEMDKITYKRTKTKTIPVHYSVRHAGRKVLDEYRGDRIYGDVYWVAKNGVDCYEVIISMFGPDCNCPAGIHGNQKCKHIAMVLEYIEKHDIG